MSHKSSRAVYRSRDCAGLEHDARVPLSEDLTTAKHGGSAPIKRKTPISAPDMTKALKVHAHNARERTAFTMHSFKSGGALTRDLAGEDLPTVMQRAFWKKLSTAWRYLRLLEVLIPGSVGNSTNGKGSMGEPSLGIQTRV